MTDTALGRLMVLGACLLVFGPFLPLACADPEGVQPTAPAAPVQLVQKYEPGTVIWEKDENGIAELICLDFYENGQCDMQLFRDRLDGYQYGESVVGRILIKKDSTQLGGWVLFAEGSHRITLMPVRCNDCPEFEETAAP